MRKRLFILVFGVMLLSGAGAAVMLQSQTSPVDEMAAADQAGTDSGSLWQKLFGAREKKPEAPRVTRGGSAFRNKTKGWIKGTKKIGARVE